MFRNLSSNWSLVPGPFFDNFVYKKGLGSKEKLKLPFLRLVDNPLSKYFTFKINFLHAMAVLGYLPKL